jgi:hypothetical protein
VTREKGNGRNKNLFGSHVRGALLSEVASPGIAVGTAFAGRSHRPVVPTLSCRRRLRLSLITAKVRLNLLQLQSQLSQPFFQRFEARSGFVFESNHEIIRIANHDTLSFAVAFSPLVDPQIEHVVQKHVGKDR